MKFRSSAAGYILGIRFYKGPKNTGTHTGKLWTKGGTLLGTVTFSGETASGWQQANFATPIAIAANTTYVVSYWSPASHYSVNNTYFTTGMTSGPLYALKDGEDGANSIYKYSSSAFPTSTWKSSNYWVDVVYNTVASTTLTAAPASVTTTLISKSVPAQAAPQMMAATAAAPAAARSLYCAPKVVQAGASFTCQIQLPVDGVSHSIPVAASSSDVRVPPAVQARAQQRLLTFRGVVDKAAPQSTFTVTAGDGNALEEEQITILPSAAPVLSLPQTQIVKAGEPISFRVSAQDPSGLTAQISASKLPTGASFQQDSGRFEWSPAANQQGSHTLTFAAASSGGSSSESQTEIVIDSGLPTVSNVARGVCSPGSIATLEGRWLSFANEELADPSGASLELSGTRVRVNNSFVPVLLASQNRVDFLCPNTAPGAGLEVTLQTPYGTTQAVQTAMLAARPSLLRARDVSDKQALATIAGTSRLATVRDYHDAGEPAQLDDVVSFRATGIQITDASAGSFRVNVGGVDAQVESILPAPDAAGVFLIQVRIPVTASLGDEVPVRLEFVSPDGHRHSSNTVTLAIE